jgi:hypothetical protein
MNRILSLILGAVLVLLGAVLVAGILYDVSGWRTGEVLAPVHSVAIRADNSSPRQYFADVVSGEGCGSRFDSYSVTQAGNTIQMKVFNLYSTTKWPQLCLYVLVEHTIPLGTDFVPGVNYTVEANNVTVTFVAQAPL